MARFLMRMIAGALGGVILLELAFRILPTGTYTDTGYHINPRIVTYRPHHSFTASSGWNFQNAHRHRTNNLGFIANRDFVADPEAVALIGDSFVDASMLAPADRLDAALESMLVRRAVMALGGPGSNLLDYAERVRFASEQLGVRDFVIVLESGDLRQAYCGSGNVHAACIDPTSGEARTELQPAPSRAKRILRHSALLQYLLGHLRADPVGLVRRVTSAWKPVRTASAPSPGRQFTEAEAQGVLDLFFQRIRPIPIRRLIMVFDADRPAINKGAARTDGLQMFVMARAKEAGATVVDLDPRFRAFVSKTGRHLEVSPMDAHWNGWATTIVAQEVARALN